MLHCGKFASWPPAAASWQPNESPFVSVAFCHSTLELLGGERRGIGPTRQHVLLCSLLLRLSAASRCEDTMRSATADRTQATIGGSIAAMLAILRLRHPSLFDAPTLAEQHARDGAPRQDERRLICTKEPGR